MKKNKSIKQAIAEREEARLEKAVNEMNGNKVLTKGEKISLAHKLRKERASAAKEAEATQAKLDALEEELKARRRDIERELADKALLGSQEAKADAGKPQLSLVPMQILNAIARVREYGNKKYGDPENWKTVAPSRYRDAMLRHAVAYIQDPNGVDEESGLPHLWHLACNVSFLVEMEQCRK